MRRVTIKQIVGANLKRFREMRVGVLKQTLLDALHDNYGITWTRQGWWRAERGERNLDVDELAALADLFGVPIWAFFIPTPEMADDELAVGNVTRPAWTILADMIHPKDEAANFQLEMHAYGLITDILRTKGQTPAVMGLTAALKAASREEVPPTPT